MVRFKGEIYLLLAAIIWGSAFIFQKMGMDHIGPFSFSAFRYVIGALVLLPVIFIRDVVTERKGRQAEIVFFS
ncbi:EamA family transporter [Lentihominibacter sp.]|uniref:EamA family transporter n=1 Tax=Lentihominibacter sp. TaxID=2944216 RepID=UPI003996B225